MFFQHRHHVRLDVNPARCILEPQSRPQQDNTQKALNARLRLLANGGDSLAALELGLRYSRTTTPNLAEMVKYIRIAANAGIPEAQSVMASCFTYGDGVPRDAAKASYWTALARAAQNDKEAFGQLGRIYERGVGVPVNLPLALYWYQKAGTIKDPGTDPEFRTVRAVQSDPKVPTFNSAPNNVAEADVYATKIEQQLNAPASAAQSSGQHADGRASGAQPMLTASNGQSGAAANGPGYAVGSHSGDWKLMMRCNFVEFYFSKSGPTASDDWESVTFRVVNLNEFKLGYKYDATFLGTEGSKNVINPSTLILGPNREWVWGPVKPFNAVTPFRIQQWGVTSATVWRLDDVGNVSQLQSCNGNLIVLEHSDNQKADDGLMYAIYHEDVSGVQLAITQGADVNYCQRPNNGVCVSTPLTFAARNDGSAMAQIVQFLLDHGADPNLESGVPADKKSPLGEAVIGLSVENVRLLLAHHARTDFRFASGDTLVDDMNEVSSGLGGGGTVTDTCNEIIGLLQAAGCCN